MKLSKLLLLMLFVFTTFSAFSQGNLKKTNIEKNNVQAQVQSLPKFYFLVTMGKTSAYFQEVTGLESEAAPVEYKKGISPTFSTMKMPGINKYGNVTLKKGMFKNDTKFWDWFNSIKANKVDRKTLTISLLDEAGNPTMTWTLKNAWPTKISGTDLKSDGNEVAVETIVFTHEGLTINK